MKIEVGTRSTLVRWFRNDCSHAVEARWLFFIFLRSNSDPDKRTRFISHRSSAVALIYPELASSPPYGREKSFRIFLTIDIAYTSNARISGIRTVSHRERQSSDIRAQTRISPSPSSLPTFLLKYLFFSLFFFF